MADQFLVQPPKGFEDIEGAEEWARAIILTFNDLLRPDGVLDGVDATLLEQDADLTAVAAATDANTINISANAAVLSGLLNSLPAYSISNASTDRTLDASIVSVSATYQEAEQLAQSAKLKAVADVLSTIINDLANKDIVG